MADRAMGVIDFRIDVDGGDVATRVGAWREHMAVSGLAIMKDEDAARFSGSTHARFFGELMVSRVTSSAFRFVRDRAFLERIDRDLVMLNYIEDGRITGTCGNRRIDAGNGCLLLLRLRTPADVEVCGTWTALVLPRVVFERRFRWINSHDGRVYSRGTVQAELIGRHISGLLEIGSAGPAEIARLTEASIAQMSLCFSGRPSRSTCEGGDTDPKAKVRRFVSARLTDPKLDADMVCRHFGLSRTGLKRLLGKGANLAGTVRRLRLHGACRDLLDDVDGRSTIGDIARRWGMPDERTFRRAFAKEFGTRPSAIRKTRPEGLVLLPAPGAARNEFQRWFTDA